MSSVLTQIFAGVSYFWRSESEVSYKQYLQSNLDAQCLNFVKASKTTACHSCQNVFYKLYDFEIVSPPFCSDLIPGFEINTPTELC